jgi:NAD(P)-dependent dehydrogenase (short-subunit alcohol dehydrogenase family)
MSFLEERANLAGKVAVVIGGAQGVGRAVTSSLGRAGVDVAVCDWAEDELAEAASELDGLGRHIMSEVVDVKEPERLDGFFDAFDSLSDRLDILVNVAGGVFRKPFLEQDPDEWAMTIQWNLLYALHSVRRATLRMRAGGRGGSIVNFTTIEAHRAVPRYAIYGAAKAALTNFTQSMALELGPDGIRINTIAIDVTQSPGSNRNRVPWPNPERSDELADARARMYVPLGRFGTPEDQANAVLFLASDLSSWITGTALHVDGGTFAASGWMNWPEGGWLVTPWPSNLERLFPVDAQP